MQSISAVCKRTCTETRCQHTGVHLKTGCKHGKRAMWVQKFSQNICLALVNYLQVQIC